MLILESLGIHKNLLQQSGILINIQNFMLMGAKFKKKSFLELKQIKHIYFMDLLYFFRAWYKVVRMMTLWSLKDLAFLF